MSPTGPRVLFLASHFPKPDNPLIGPWALRQALAFSRAGCQVLVVSPTSYVPTRLAVTPGARVYARCPRSYQWGELPVHYPRWLVYPVPPFKALAYRWPRPQLALGWATLRAPLLELCGTWRPDVVYSHHTLPNGWMAARLQRSFPVPFVVTDHDFQELEDSAKLPGRRAALSGVIGRAARLVAINGRLQRAYHALSPLARVELIPNGVDLPPEVLPPRPAALNGPLVFSCGLFYERKGIELLVQAFARALPRVPGAHLRIAGDGPRRASVEATIRSCGVTAHVTLLGKLPPEDVAREMAWADAFALVGWDEPFATVYLEAMAAARPVVCASDGGITDVLQDEVHGLLVPPRNPEAAAQALVRLLRSPELRARLGGNGRRLVESSLTWDAVAARYRQVFEQVVAERGRSTPARQLP